MDQIEWTIRNSFVVVVLNTTMNSVHKVTFALFAHINRQFSNSNCTLSQNNNVFSIVFPSYDNNVYVWMHIHVCGRPLPIKGYKVIIALFISNVPLERKFLNLILKRKVLQTYNGWLIYLITIKVKFSSEKRDNSH